MYRCQDIMVVVWPRYTCRNSEHRSKILNSGPKRNTCAIPTPVCIKYQNFTSVIRWAKSLVDPGFLRRGRHSPKCGRRPIYSTKLLPKTAWKWKRLYPDERVPGTPPPFRSANAIISEYVWIFTLSVINHSNFFLNNTKLTFLFF